MYIGLRPKVSESEPQNSGDMPWMIKYDVMVSETALRLTFRSYGRSTDVERVPARRVSYLCYRIKSREIDIRRKTREEPRNSNHDHQCPLLLLRENVIERFRNY